MRFFIELYISTSIRAAAPTHDTRCPELYRFNSNSFMQSDTQCSDTPRRREESNFVIEFENVPFREMPIADESATELFKTVSFPACEF